MASVPPLPGAELIFGGFCPPLQATDETIGEPGSEEARILGPTAAPEIIFIYRYKKILFKVEDVLVLILFILVGKQFHSLYMIKYYNVLSFILWITLII